MAFMDFFSDNISSHDVSSHNYLPTVVYELKRILINNILSSSLFLKNEFFKFFKNNRFLKIFKKKRYFTSFERFFGQSSSVYSSLRELVVGLNYIFKNKNSYNQVKYDNKIIFQNSIGMYGFQKKEKTTRHSKRILSRSFVEYFSNILFNYGERINISLKGFRKSYKRSVRHLISNLQLRLGGRSDANSNFFKLMIKKISIVKSAKRSNRLLIQTSSQRSAEREVVYERVKSKLYSFLYVKCFYLTSPSFGGIRLRLKNKPRYNFY